MDAAPTTEPPLQPIVDRLARSALVGEIWTRFGSTLEWELLVPIVTEKTVETIGAEAGSLWLRDPAKDEVTCVMATGAAADRIRGQVLPMGRGIVGSVISSGEARFIPDVRQAPEFTASIDRQSGFQTRSMIVAAIRVPGRVLGAIEVINKRGTDELFTQDDLDLLLMVCSAAGQALENARLHAELARAYHRVAEANRSLVALDRAKAEFIAVASHELRTPISSILGYLHLIRTDPDGVPEHLKASLETVEKSAERLSSIVVRITDALRVDSNGYTLEKVRADASSLAREVVDELAGAVAKRKLKLATELAEGCLAELDPDKVKVALSNLLRNAIRFTPDHGRIEVKVARGQGSGGEPTVTFEVSDTGMGVPPHETEHIFDRFATGADPMTHHSGTFEYGSRGIGLGLHLARSLARAHGGDITVDSTLGRGSTFRMSIPVMRS